MLIHRVKVQECASAAITEVEYKHCLNRIREYVGPLSESASYQMLCSSSKPPAMIQKQETFERKMRRNLFGLYEISVWINEKRFNFIIDSGAQISGIRRRCLEQLHLQTIQGKLEIGSVGAKKMMLEAVMASSVDIGGISWQHVPLVILEQQQFSMPFFHHDLLRFDGILGWDLLSQIDFEMDTIAGRFKVFPNRFRLDHPNLLSCSFPAVLVRNEKNEVSLFGIDKSFGNDNTDKKIVTSYDKNVSLDAKVDNSAVQYVGNENRPAVYAYVSKAMNLKTYLDGEAPVYSWPGEEGHVTLQNNTAISGDYITVNDDNEGVLLNDASESFYLHVTDKNAVVPSFYISLGTGEGSTAETERMFLFNPVDSVAYPVNMDYDPNYQLSKADTKAIFKAGTMDASRDTLTTTIKGEVRPVAELADNDNTWGGLNRFKFQLIETADLDGTYNVRQTRGSIREDGTPGSETVYLASSSQKLYFTPEKAYALALHIEGVEAPTANEGVSATEVKVVAYDGAINIKNAAGKNVVVSTILGQIVANEVLTSDNATIAVPAGIAIVSVDGEEAVKVSVR